MFTVSKMRFSHIRLQEEGEKRWRGRGETNGKSRDMKEEDAEDERKFKDWAEERKKGLEGNIYT